MTDYAVLKKYLEELGCPYRENEPMSEHTSFKIGGPADLYLAPASPAVLASVLAACTRWEVRTLILGNGSNLLVSDNGFRGAVINVSGLASLELAGACEIVCGAGVRLSRLCNFALEHSLTGLEFAWGIPGTAGGAACMNAGAYDGEMRDVLLSCEHITPLGATETLAADQLELGYRTSVYAHNGCTVTAMRLRLTPGVQADIFAKMEDFMQRRKAKQPLEYPSAGSVFKRPPGKFAGALIEQCGLKGYSVGGAMVSEKHAGFIVNTGGATCSDVCRLIEHIKREVFLNASVTLECEVKIVG